MAVSAIVVCTPFIVICSVFGNVLTITAVFKTRSLRCRYAVLLITSLAFCDLLFSLLSCPVNFATTLLDLKKLDEPFCSINGFLGLLFVLTSVLTLSIVSVDRYVAIVKPFRYNILVTYNRIKIMIVFKWTLAGIVATVPLSGWGKFIFYPQKGFCFIDYHEDVGAFIFLGAFFNIGFALITFSYYHIFKEARRQKRQIQSLNVGNVPHFNDASSEQSMQQYRNNIRKIKHENKAALTIFAIIGGFLVCWMPFVAVNLSAALLNFQIPKWVDVIATLLVALASSVNPLFYAWLDNSFRAAFKRILYPIFRRNGSAPVTIVSTLSGGN